MSIRRPVRLRAQVQERGRSARRHVRHRAARAPGVAGVPTAPPFFSSAPLHAAISRASPPRCEPAPRLSDRVLLRSKGPRGCWHSVPNPTYAFQRIARSLRSWQRKLEFSVRPALLAFATKTPFDHTSRFYSMTGSPDPRAAFNMSPVPIPISSGSSWSAKSPTSAISRKFIGAREGLSTSHRTTTVTP